MNTFLVPTRYDLGWFAVIRANTMAEAQKLYDVFWLPRKDTNAPKYPFRLVFRPQEAEAA